LPNRILRESILTSDGVNQLDAAEERFYRRLMSVVDDFGRYDGRPNVIRAACFPLLLDKVREADCSRWMAACQKAGLIVLYEVDSKPYIWMPKLGEPRAKHSKYPDLPESARTCAQANASVPYSNSNAPTNSNSLSTTPQRRGGQELPPIPESLQTPEFIEAWGEWIESRRQIRHPLTPIAAKRQLRDCEAWGVQRSIAAINNSIGGSYQKLCEPRGAHRPADQETPDQYARRLAAQGS
jgi:hypothetical protein